MALLTQTPRQQKDNPCGPFGAAPLAEPGLEVGTWGHGSRS